MRCAASPFAPSSGQGRRGFSLVELMVVAAKKVKATRYAHSQRSDIERQQAEYYSNAQLKLLITPPPVSKEKKVIDYFFRKYVLTV